MYAGTSRCRGLWIPLPLEELAEGKMLHDRELAQHFCVVHLQHALVDLSPTIFDAGNIEQDRRVLPERSLLDVENELDGTVVHIT